jgi:hypothetical protein
MVRIGVAALSPPFSARPSAQAEVALGVVLGVGHQEQVGQLPPAAKRVQLRLGERKPGT